MFNSAFTSMHSLLFMSHLCPLASEDSTSAPSSNGRATEPRWFVVVTNLVARVSEISEPLLESPAPAIHIPTAVSFFSLSHKAQTPTREFTHRH